MSSQQFGQLERIRDIREYWPREDTDFTPWLGSEENISILGDAIGVELEVQEQEASVGPFRADILCKNTADNSYVLIENQFGRTDHSHLGQLFTYAAGLDAVTLVWVVERFTEEHRAAIDWLNRISDDKFHFFGIEIELWRIGDSLAAPKFNVVSKPNDWVKIVREAAESRSQSGQSEWQKMKVDFWRRFGEHLSATNPEFKAPKPSTSLWVGYGIGRANTGLEVAFTQRTVSVYVVISNRDRAGWFQYLSSKSDEIEAELGTLISEELFWSERSDMKYSHIGISKDVSVTEEENWPDIFEWLSTSMSAMKLVFKSRVKSIPDDL